MKVRLVLLMTVVVSVMAGLAAAWSKSPAWDAAASAKYLDAREVWWQEWPKAERDQDTQCISCHTVVPYALSRPVLHTMLGEKGLTPQEERMLGDVKKRVAMWKDVEPFYQDTPERAVGARNSEAVLNALILASYDAGTGRTSELTRKAFDAAWAEQATTGKDAGGWVWLNFHNSPWEGEDSPYQGASFAALAVGLAPGYGAEAGNKARLKLLEGYLQRNYEAQPLVNKLVVLWVSAKLPGLLTAAQKGALAKEVFALEQADGGWRTPAFVGAWKRHDDSAFDTASDGYATALVVLAMESSGVVARGDARLRPGLEWLSKNQDKAEGFWASSSLNHKIDPKNGASKFMTDAATAYAVLALDGDAGR